jgi:DNA-binding GntR family transcriptional regulator
MAMNTNVQVDEIVETLRSEIISGTLEPNETLGQEHLAKRFNVSRMPIREAIQRLQFLGFVSVEQNKRARVAPVSLGDFLDIYDMRIAAETLALRSAIPELTNSLIEKAENYQHKIEEAPVTEFGALNMGLHLTLYGACNRPRLLAHIDALGNAADRYHCMSSIGPEYHAKSNAEHYAILDACKARDATAAHNALEKHITEARDALSKAMSMSNLTVV